MAKNKFEYNLRIYKLMRAYTKILETPNLLSSILTDAEKQFVLSMWQANVQHDHRWNGAELQWTPTRMFVANSIWVKLSKYYDPQFDIPPKFDTELKRKYQMFFQ